MRNEKSLAGDFELITTAVASLRMHTPSAGNQNRMLASPAPPAVAQEHGNVWRAFRRWPLHPPSHSPSPLLPFRFPHPPSPCLHSLPSSLPSHPCLSFLQAFPFSPSPPLTRVLPLYPSFSTYPTPKLTKKIHTLLGIFKLSNLPLSVSPLHERFAVNIKRVKLINIYIKNFNS